MVLKHKNSDIPQQAAFGLSLKEQILLSDNALPPLPNGGCTLKPVLSMAIFRSIV